MKNRNCRKEMIVNNSLTVNSFAPNTSLKGLVREKYCLTSFRRIIIQTAVLLKQVRNTAGILLEGLTVKSSLIRL
jgi:hypothetical protein